MELACSERHALRVPALDTPFNVLFESRVPHGCSRAVGKHPVPSNRGIHLGRAYERPTDREPIDFCSIRRVTDVHDDEAVFVASPVAHQVGTTGFGEKDAQEVPGVDGRGVTALVL